MSLESELKREMKEICREVLTESGAVVESYEAMSPTDAAKELGVSKQSILDLIADRERSKFPAAKLSQKTFVISRPGFMKWLRDGGLLKIEQTAKEEETETKLRAIK